MAKNDKSPAFRWYPKDVLTSQRVALLTLKEEGAYRRALDYCWLNGSLPSDPKDLARIIGKGCTVTIAKKIKNLFVPLDGTNEKLVHDRLEFERQKQNEWSEKCRIGGKNSAIVRKIGEVKGKGSSPLVEDYLEVNPNISFSLPLPNNNTVIYTHPLAIYANALKRVSKLEDQLTDEEAEKLVADFGEPAVRNILDRMNNYKPLVKNNVSVYRTARNWIESDNAKKIEKSGKNINMTGLTAN